MGVQPKREQEEMVVVGEQEVITEHFCLYLSAMTTGTMSVRLPGDWAAVQTPTDLSRKRGRLLPRMSRPRGEQLSQARW